MATDPAVLSVNVGAPAVLREGRAPTGIGKVPVDAIDVADPGRKRRGPSGEGFSGVAGDFIGSGRHHGGADQAVYAFAREELDHWERELGRTLAPGLFGENLTTVGLDVDAAEQGDTWTVGTAVLRVSAPRVPCANFAFRMQERAWVRRFAERGRGGCYLAVERGRPDRPGRPGRGRAVRAPAWRSRCCSPGGWATSTRPARRWGTTRLDGESRGHFTRLLAKRA